MGSSTSRIGSDRPSQPSRINRTKRKLSSLLLCGLPSTSTSHSSVVELESPISSTENIPPASAESVNSAGVSSSFFGSEPLCTSSKTSGAEPEESESCKSSTKNAVVKCDSKRDINSTEDEASTSYEDHPIQEAISGNAGSDSASAIAMHNLVNEGTPLSSSDNTSPSTVGQNDENPMLDENSGENPRDGLRSADSDSRALLVLSDSFLSLRMFGIGSATSRSGFFSSDADPDLRGGHLLLVGAGSVSPNIFSGGFSEFGSREARRNSRGLFGDPSSRRISRRDGVSQALVFTDGLGDDLGSRDRWLLDIGGDHHYEGHGHGRGYGYSRSHRRYEERRHFRSEMSERGLDALDEREHQTIFCASGLHPEGTCSCGSSFMDVEAGSFGSISRVVLLAQALSEVLDEIHRQPLSLSMPMLSLPAPESVVDSFPLKNHKKMEASESGPNYVQQCYICLVDYEEGDKKRVLPCQHEYHAPCVDKWLKEVNGVCPVCRCNVCEIPAAANASVSGLELPTQ